MAATTPAIEAVGLVKTFGELRAVDGVDRRAGRARQPDGPLHPREQRGS